MQLISIFKCRDKATESEVVRRRSHSFVSVLSRLLWLCVVLHCQKVTTNGQNYSISNWSVCATKRALEYSSLNVSRRVCCCVVHIRFGVVDVFVVVAGCIRYFIRLGSCLHMCLSQADEQRQRLEWKDGKTWNRRLFRYFFVVVELVLWLGQPVCINHEHTCLSTNGT